MRFSFATVALLFAAFSASNAAVVPRANVNAGLAARYYADSVYPRETFTEVPNVARTGVVGENRVDTRYHPRDFLAKRAEAGRTETEEHKAKRSLRVLNRRVHARDFRVGRVTV
jgi:hypothetical protein